ncbi:MAG: cytochrome c [Thermodesulfobacteriota bacterium]
MTSFNKTVLFVFAVLTAFQLLSIESVAVAAINAKDLYGKWCSQCHGSEGKGDGINSTPDMAINPRDHTDSTFMITRSDEQFEQIISHGGTAHAKSPLMPMWHKTLTEEEIKALVRYLRELCRCEYQGSVSSEKLHKADPKFR